MLECNTHLPGEMLGEEAEEAHSCTCNGQGKDEPTRSLQASPYQPTTDSHSPAGSAHSQKLYRAALQIPSLTSNKVELPRENYCYNQHMITIIIFTRLGTVLSLL